MKRIVFFLLLLTSSFSLPTTLHAQRPNQPYLDYIERYHAMAQEQMYRHRIPASITLAQGLLESAAGRSDLAVRANNHFGIKVGTDWTGPYVVKSDDNPNDRFRKYASVKDSYEDHSAFLQKKRYASLFDLRLTDYKGWAHGLKQCGYATSPTYAHQLITIIENYDLHRFDGGGFVGSSHHNNDVMQDEALSLFFTNHPVQACNRNFYIIVCQGDNLPTLAMMTGVSKRKLLRYNELPKGYVPKAGDVLFLEKKRSRADKSMKGTPHVVSQGESMHDIAQHYGIRLKSLYKMNELTPDYVPLPGHMLKVY